MKFFISSLVARFSWGTSFSAVFSVMMGTVKFLMFLPVFYKGLVS